MIYQNCDNCPYAETTNDFMTRYCTLYGKVVFVTDGCDMDDDSEDDDL